MICQLICCAMGTLCSHKASLRSLQLMLILSHHILTWDNTMQVPPPPGVRPWNWRRQQARAVARQQALAAKAEGKEAPQAPTSAAEALLLAAEQQGSGSPPQVPCS